MQPLSPEVTPTSGRTFTFLTIISINIGNIVTTIIIIINIVVKIVDTFIIIQSLGMVKKNIFLGLCPK